MEVVNSPQTGDKPVLLTDIDGVFLVADEEVPGRCPAGYEISPGGSSYEFYNPDHGSWLKELLPAVDWYWLTSHDDSSHDDIGQPLGLPEVAWVDFRSFEQEYFKSELDNPSNIAPDLNLPRRKAIDSFFSERTVIWVEDELTQYDSTWAHQRKMQTAPTLLVRPDSSEGLQYFHIARITAWLGNLAIS